MTLSPLPNPPIVSVVMAAHNAGPYVQAAVESILGQTMSDFELVVVDDGSTDATGSLLAGFAAGDRRVVLLRNAANTGYTRSLNRALALARGCYVARHDADDYSAPTRLQEQVDLLEQHPRVGLLGTLVQVIDEDGQALKVDPFASGTDDAALQAELLHHNPFCHGSIMLRRASLSQVGNYDESLELTEDYDLWLRLAEVTTLAKLPRQLYHYRQHAASVSHQRRGQQIVAQARTLEKAMRRRHGAHPPALLLGQVADNYRQAADFYVQQGDLSEARQHLSQAIALCPQLFEAPEVYVPVPTGTGDLPFAESVLADLARTRPYNRVRRLLLARLHMRRAFAAAGSGDQAELQAHLWPGLYHDPRWLLNRGVLVLTVRALLGHVRRRSPATSTVSAQPIRKDKQS